MFPELPKDLAALTDDELAALADEFLEVVRAVKARDEDVLGDRTAEQIVAEMQAGVEALEQIRSVQSDRVEAETNFNATLEELTARVADEEPEDEEAAEEDSDEADGDSEAAEAEAVVASTETKPVRRPLPNGRRHRASANMTPEGAPILSRSGLTVIEPGVQMDRGSIGRVYHDLIRGNRISPGQKMVVASATFPFPEDRILDDKNIGLNLERIAAVNSPSALVASGGLCAPLTPIYDLPGVESTARPVRDALASFQAARGGVIVAANPVITDYADAVGTVTEANDTLGGTFATKNCMRIECPQFSEVTVDSFYRCIEAGNLTARAYPELMSRIDLLARANHARLADGALLDTIKAGSTAVTGGNTATTGAVWEFLGHVLVAVSGMRSRHRMPDGARFRALLPEWILDLLQLDISRGQFDRFGGEAQVRSILSGAGINATFYKDGPATGTGQVFAAQTAGAQLVFPTDVQWAIYPEGSWLHLDSGTLELGIVRDSTLNSTNDFQIFAETWEQAAFVGVESQWITSTICPNGTVSAPKDLSAVCTA